MKPSLRWPVPQSTIHSPGAPGAPGPCSGSKRGEAKQGAATDSAPEAVRTAPKREGKARAWKWSVALFGGCLGPELLRSRLRSARRTLGRAPLVYRYNCVLVVLQKPLFKKGSRPHCSLCGKLGNGFLRTAPREERLEHRQPAWGPVGGAHGGWFLQEVSSSRGLEAVALLLPPAAQPGEGQVPHALQLREAQLVEDLIDSCLRRHLGKTVDMGPEVPGGQVTPAPTTSPHLLPYARLQNTPPASSVTQTSLCFDHQ